MKKQYEKPRLEVTEFCFSEHIAAASGECVIVWLNVGPTSCTTGTPVKHSFNN